MLASAVGPHETWSPTVGWLEARIMNRHTRTHTRTQTDKCCSAGHAGLFLSAECRGDTRGVNRGKDASHREAWFKITSLVFTQD